MKKPRPTFAARQRRASYAAAKAPGRARHAAQVEHGGRGGGGWWPDLPLSAPAGVVLRSAASDQAFLEVRGLLPVADDASGPWQMPSRIGTTTLPDRYLKLPRQGFHGMGEAALEYHAQFLREDAEAEAYADKLGIKPDPEITAAIKEGRLT